MAVSYDARSFSCLSAFQTKSAAVGIRPETVSISLMDIRGF